MTVPRVLLGAGRILLTKPGYAAVPTVVEEGKVFDSNWEFTGTLLARGLYIDTAPPISPGSVYTYSAANPVIAVPLPFTPREVFVQLSSAGITAVREFTVYPSSAFYYANGLLTFYRQAMPPEPQQRYVIRDLIYRVYSV